MKANVHRPELNERGFMNVAEAIGAKMMGARLYELEPHGKHVPYHWHVVEEEWLLVVQGTATIRTPDGEQVLREGDVVVFPVGPAGAHLWRNDSDAPIRVLMWSNAEEMEVCVYPDSGKIGAWTPYDGIRLMNRPEANLDYWDGEPQA